MIYTLTESAKEFLNENFEKYSQDEMLQENNDEININEKRSPTKAENAEPGAPASRGGKWDYVIGLVVSTVIL